MKIVQAIAEENPKHSIIPSSLFFPPKGAFVQDTERALVHASNPHVGRSATPVDITTKT
jgi:hypothetical protein